jgi:anaerobic selenocysteine-containing dehydrogenase
MSRIYSKRQPNETCAHNCGGRCVANVRVVDERVVKISTDPRWQPEMPPRLAKEKAKALPSFALSFSGR